MIKPTIPYCGRKEPCKSECGSCAYYNYDYCSYWYTNNPDDCMDSNESEDSVHHEEWSDSMREAVKIIGEIISLAEELFDL